MVVNTARDDSPADDRAAPQRQAGFREPGPRHPELPRARWRSRRTAARPGCRPSRTTSSAAVRRDGLGLNFQNTVRAISSRVDLARGRRGLPASASITTMPVVASAALHSTARGVYMFVALETSRAGRGRRRPRRLADLPPQRRPRAAGPGALRRRQPAVRQQFHGSHGQRLRHFGTARPKASRTCRWSQPGRRSPAKS